MSFDFDVLVIGSGPAGQKAAIQAAKLGKRVGIVERRRHGRRRLRQHRHDPVEDAARGRALPDRASSQREIYGHELPRQGRDHDRGSRRPRRPRDRARDRRDPRPAAAQPRRADLTATAQLPRPAHASTIRPATARRAAVERRADHHRDRHRARAARPTSTSTTQTVIDSDGILHLEPHPRLARRRRRRRDRHRVRLDVRGARARRSRSSSGGRGCSSSSTPRSSRRCSYHLRDLGVAFRLGESRSIGGRRATTAATVTRCSRAASAIAAEAVLYSAGRQGATDGLDLDAAGLEADKRGRITVDADYRTAVDAHLRGRRRDRLPEPRRDLDGAGPPRRLRTRSASRASRCRRAAAVRHLLDSGDHHRRQDRGGADGGGRAVRGRHLALPRARPRPDPRRRARHAQAARLARRPAAARRRTSSAPAPPSSSTSARR